MLDLDGFKAVNDSFGHKVGDELLKQVGRVIRGQLRDYDFLARYGGDEFVALIPETTDEDVADLCSRIEKAVCTFTLPVGDFMASVGVSLGSSGYPDDGDTFDKMVAAADMAMYNCKISRRQPVIIDGVEVVAPPEESLIVELDESHVVISGQVN
jgi:diguanylate cyclase (GGDEF)-like protein